MIRKPVLILLTGSIPDYYQLNQTFADLFLASANYPSGAEVLDVTTQTPPENFNHYSAFIITGSLAMVTDRESWSERLAGWLKVAISQEASILGICYGHQLMAKALGGQVDFHPNGIELGTHLVSLKPLAQNHPFLSFLPDSFEANMAHSQTVITPPKEAQILATSAHDAHQILSYGPKIITTQFHPEFNLKIMELFIKVNPNLVFAKPKETPVAKSLLQYFVDQSLSEPRTA
jgi:GMP synthase (glutamine-hydrolysing)